MSRPQIPAPGPTNSPDATRPGFVLLSLLLALALSCKSDVKTGPDFGPAAITSQAPSQQLAEVGADVPIAPVVRVTREDGEPAPGVVVTFAITGGNGEIPVFSAVTGSDGMAGVGRWTLGTTAGVNSLTATATGLVGSPVTFLATGTPGAPVTIDLISSPPPIVASGVRFSTQPVVQLRDMFGNAAGSPGVPVAVSLTPAVGAVLEGTTSRSTNASGTAAFTDLDVKGVAGDYTMLLSAPGLPEVPALLHVTAGPPSRLVLISQPSSAGQSGVALGSQPVVALEDMAGNRVPQAGLVVSATLASGGGTLVGGVTALTDGTGTARFTGLGIAGLAGTRTLAFSAPGLSGTTSGVIQVSAGAASRLTQGPGDGQSAPAGTPVAVNPSVLVTDANGNPVAGVSVTWSISAGGGQIAQPQSVSDAQGAVSAGTWTLGSVPGSNAITASAVGLAGSPISFGATGTLPSGAKLTLTTQPLAGNSGVALSPAPVVQLVDVNGGVISQAGVPVTAAIASGGGTLAGTLTVPTDAAGAASFTALALAGLAGNRILTFTAPGFIAVSSTTIVLGAGPAAVMVLQAGDNQTAPASTPVAVNPSVRITDASDNPVPGITVNFAVTAGGGTIANAVAVSGPQGAASGGAWTLGPLAGSNLLTATSPGLAGSPVTFRATGTVVSGPPASMMVVSGNGQTALAGAAAPESLVVRVLDANGTGVSGVDVIWSVTGGGGSISPASVTTDATGRAGAEWTLGVVAGPNSLNAGAGSLSAGFSAEGIPGSASRLQLVTQPTTGVPGQVLSPQPLVQLADANGNAVAAAGVNVTASLASGGGNLGGSNLVLTDASGLATFTDLFITGPIGPRTLRFSAPALTPVTSNPITLSPAVVASVQISPATLTLLVGETQSLTAVALDGNGVAIPGAVFVWTSTNPGIVTVNASGGAAGIAAGNARIAVSSGGQSDTATVVVQPVPVSSVVVSPATATLVQGGTQAFQAVAFDSAGGVLPGRPFTWTSANSTVAAVDNAGVVTGLAPGSARIVAATGGKSDTASVQVTLLPPPMQLVFSSYIGGTQQDQVRDIATDAQGNIYVAGGTASPDFPVTPGALDKTFNGTYDAYIAKLSPNGTVLWATFLGGPNYDRAYSIEVDAAGFIYVAGRAGAGFPVTPGAFQTTFAGSPDDPPYGPQDGFVCKLAPNATAIVFCSYFGTSDPKIVRDVAVDPKGGIYLGSSSESGTFPAAWFANGAQRTNSGGLDGVVAKISPNGSKVLWATYVGGSLDEAEEASIRVNSSGEAYALYSTASADAPTPNGFDHTLGTIRDMYLVKIAANGTRLLFGTFLGGDAGEHVETHELALDAQDNAIIASGTTSLNFPTTPGAFQSTYGGSGGPGFGEGTNYNGDIFVAKISSDGSQLMAATYVGGPGGEGAEGVGVDASGNIYVSGVTYSAHLPFMARGYQPQLGGDADLVVLKFTPDLTQLIYGTYLGGVDQDYARTSIATPGGDFIVGGNIVSTDFPTLNPFQPQNHGGLDGGVAKFH